MSTVKINELGAGTPTSTDLVPFADPTTGLAEKATLTQVASVVEPLLTGKADLNGNSAEQFEVADATSSTQAVSKNQLDVAINALQGALIPQGNWNASTNTPDISGTTTTGYYWIVNVAGSTNLDGITDWEVNDWAIKTATGWAKIDNTDKVISVAGKTGVVTLQYTDITDFSTGISTLVTKSFIDALGINAKTLDTDLVITGTVGDASRSAVLNNGFAFVVNRNSSTTSGDPEFAIDVDGVRKSSFGYDDDGNGHTFIYSWNGKDIHLGSTLGQDILKVRSSLANGGVLVQGETESNSFKGTGTLLTDLNATEITSGTLADARLSSNVALKDQDNNFSVEQTFESNVNIQGQTNAKNIISDSVASYLFNGVSQENLAWGESYISNYRSRELELYSTYFPNSSALYIAQLKQMGVLNKAKILFHASASRASVLPNVKGSNFTFARSGNGGTYVDENGIIQDGVANEPRIDFVDGHESLLLEPATTNLFDYSEDLILWGSPIGLSVSADSTISPDGSLNADLVTEDTSTGAHTIRKLVGPTITATNDYSFSFFVKSNGRDIVALSNDAGSASANAFLNITSGSVLSSTFDSISMVDYGNGWWRIETTLEATGTGDYNTRIYTAIADGSFSHTGDGTSGFYLWGLQVEQQSYATSYIPTSGSTATRAAETCNGAGTTAEINSTEGVLFWESKSLSNPTSSTGGVSLSDGTTTNRILLYFRDALNDFRVVLTKSSSNVIEEQINLDYSGYNKLALHYKDNDFRVYINGLLVFTDVSQTMFASDTLNELAFDLGGGVNPAYCRTKKLSVYDQALSTTELEELTGFTSFAEMASYLSYS